MVHYIPCFLSRDQVPSGPAEGPAAPDLATLDAGRAAAAEESRPSADAHQVGQRNTAEF